MFNKSAGSNKGVQVGKCLKFDKVCCTIIRKIKVNNEICSTFFFSCPVSDTSATLKTFAFIALITYVCAFSFGFGPITWILLSEIFPPSVKGRAMAIVTSINWALNFVISGSFLQLSNMFTLGGLYVMYAILCLISIIFVHMTVPETKGKTLEDISKTLKTQ